MQCHIVCFHLFIPLNVFYTCTFKLIKPMENILFFLEPIYFKVTILYKI